ncbi:MAG: helix-turn-helix domain-containing protein [Dehalococcoidia bacterium]
MTASLTPRYRKPNSPGNNPGLIRRVEGLVEEGLIDRHIGRMLGVSHDIVRSIRRRQLDNLPAGSTFRLSPSIVARQLGVGNHAVLGWIRRGLLPARKPPMRQATGARSYYRIDDDDVLDFLANPAYWHEWRTEDIVAPDLREWADALNRPRYLSVAEVAERMVVECHTVTWWIRKGLLPGARTFAGGRNWRIPESDLENFRLPSEQPRETLWRTAWKPAEDSALLAGLDALAAQLGRTPYACIQRYNALLRRRKEQTS